MSCLLNAVPRVRFYDELVSNWITVPGNVDGCVLYSLRQKFHNIIGCCYELCVYLSCVSALDLSLHFTSSYVIGHGQNNH